MDGLSAYQLGIRNLTARTGWRPATPTSSSPSTAGSPDLVVTAAN